MDSSPQQSPQTSPSLSDNVITADSFPINPGHPDKTSSSTHPPSTSPPPELSPPAPPTSPPPPPSPPPKASPPPPEASTPPPEESLPPPLLPSPPPRQAPPPDDSASPPPPTSSAPLPSTIPSSPPPPILNPPPAPGAPPAPVILPPPPRATASPTPPSPSLSPPHLPRSAATNRSSSHPAGSSTGLVPPPPDATVNSAIIAGIIVGGVVLLALIIACLILSRRKKKPSYYIDPGCPPTGGDLYYNPSTHWHSPFPMDHIVNLEPPPGVVGTPVVVVGGGWGAPITSPPPAANTSSDFSSGYSGQHLTPMQQPQSPNMGGIGSKSQFTYEELNSATNGFSQSNLLGQGGFGLVHKGVLPDGKEVAVKSLKSGSGQGEREFQAEVEIISRVHHRHLVSLVGYCIADGQRMLVYEFVPNKTLQFHLHGKGQPVMDWATRLRIAVGSAKGLAYLHEDCHPRIIHRDIKAANILLDFNFEAMVADFGLAKLTSDNFTHVSTRVMGTFGYLAPEYASSGKLTEKSDVFSFGVMLLELITGRRPLNKNMEDSLVDWARPLLSKSLEDGNYDPLVDPRLEDNYIPHEIALMVSCAAACIRHSARRRPKMSQIVRTLDGDASLDDLNEGVNPGQCMSYMSPNGNAKTYDTRAYNADMMKFKKMVMSSHEFNSSEYGATSEYGLNPSSSSSDSRETDKPSSDEQRR
ncbi:proline-rich receptor-like protein kinase PERK15 [Primulina eburnea]|uniref:proline-rich receptor-like protein kinase PERK15 n=1 Tax=Primulina eburnea TaxID=1245227 RepID=UPI003C6C37EC